MKMGVRFIDLITTSSMMLQNSIPDTTYLLHVEERVDTDTIHREISEECGVYKARLYAAKFDKARMRNNVNNTSFRTMIDKMDTYHFLHGSIYVILRNDDINIVNDNWLFEATGRLSRVRGNKCIFYLTKWCNIGERDNPTWSAGGVRVSRPVSFGVIGDMVESSISTHSFCQPKVPDRLQEVGVEISNPRMIELPKVPEYTYQPLGQLGVASANERMQDTLPPVTESIVPVKHVESPKVVESKSEINRAHMVEINHDILEKINDLDRIEDSISEYVLSELVPDETIVPTIYAKLGYTLKIYWNIQSQQGVGFTGKKLFETALDRIEMSEDDKRSVKSLFILYDSSMVDTWVSGEDCNDEYSALNIVIKYRESILYRLYEVILQLSCNLEYVDARCKSETGVSVFEYIEQTPYRLGFIANISVKDMDKLAITVGLFNSENQLVDRSIAYYHEYLTDENKMDGSTIMLEQQARVKIKPGYYLTKAEYARLSQVNGKIGVYFDYNLQTNIKAFFSTEDRFMALPLAGWKQGYDGCYLPTPNAFDLYISQGMGVRVQLGKTYLIDFSVYKKELYIYNKLYRMSSPIGVIKDIDTYIDKFELSQGANFKLEERQRKAIKQCFEPENTINVITGGAGSGKTTLIKAIVYIYNTVLGYNYDSEDDDDIDILFVAPTGKAANRIYESTGFPARTIHSRFKIGLAANVDIRARVLFVDECSMINLDVMYDMLRNLPDDIRVVFSGDINQLVPIGFGQCFADMMNFAPVVTLNVMKRAEGTSLIAKNAKRLVSGYEALATGSDFRISNIADYNNAIIEKIGELSTDGIDNIQVISPVSTDKYTWGTSKMNVFLQSVLNPNVPLAKKIHHRRYKDCYDTFQVGDRVIQTKNDSELSHYKLVDGRYEKSGQGVLNGDIGKVCNIITSLDMSMKTLDDDLLSLAERGNTIFVEVEYTVAGDTYSVMYTTRTSNDDGKPTYNGYETVGGDISQIQLGYAITVHKMQGSQAKHIIILWYSMRRKDFLSRNMLYTAITRAEKSVTIFGDDYAIESARHIVSNLARTTFLKVFFNEPVLKKST